jgi:hypothetical protein
MSIGQGIKNPSYKYTPPKPPKVESPPRGATALKPIKTTPKFTSIEES